MVSENAALLRTWVLDGPWVASSSVRSRIHLPVNDHREGDAVQIEGLLAASGGGVEEPDHESFWVNNGGDKRTTVCTALAM
jgi:hypothetical protein